MASNEIRYRRSKRPFTISLVLIALFVSTLFLLSNCNQSESEDTAFLNHLDSVSYVGIQTCASCHPDKYQSFMHTGMGSSFGLATREKSSARFGPEHLVVDSASGLAYYPYWSGEQLYIKEFYLENGDTIHQLDVKVDYIIGSGQHTNSHLYERNGYLFQAPLTFYTQEHYWELPPGFENGNNSRFNRMIDMECMSCHNALPTMHETSSRKFEELPMGIDCERCHGPGELHVNTRARGEGVDVSIEADPTIVNPSRLDWNLQMDLCQRCHLQGLNLLKEGKRFEDFRPGMKLSSVFDVYLPLYQGGNPNFDMANHSDRLQKSKCFIQSNTEGSLKFTCISCHDPHKGITQTANDYYSSVCMQCHQNDVCNGLPEGESMGSANCVSCHMPESSSSDILHVKIHDHYIRKPIHEEEQTKMKKLLGLYAVNNPEPSKEEEIRAYLEYWEKFDKNPFYLNKAEELLKFENYTQLKLKLAYLKEDYSSVIQLAKDIKDLSAWQAYMVGESMLQEGELSAAKVFLQMSYLEDPDLWEVGLRLLKTLNLSEDYVKAELLALELIEKHPLNAELWTEYAVSQLRQSKEAKYAVNQALQLGPLDLKVWELQLNYYGIINESERQKIWAKRILDAYPEHPDVALLKSYL